MKQLILRKGLLFTALALPIAVFAQLDLLSSPKSIDEIKKLRTTIPSWKILKDSVRVDIPYPQTVEVNSWKKRDKEYRSQLLDYSAKISSIAVVHDINFFRSGANEANTALGEVGQSKELSQMMASVNEMLGENNQLSQLMQGSKDAIALSGSSFGAVGYDSEAAKELGLKYDQPKDSSPKLKQEYNQLTEKLKSVRREHYDLFIEAQEGALQKQLEDELKKEIEKRAEPIYANLKVPGFPSYEEERRLEQLVQRVSTDWYKKNYTGDGCRGLQDARKATAYMLATYLPLAEKVILIESRIYGFEPSLFLQELYLNALKSHLDCRMSIHNKMITCFDRSKL